MVRQLPAATLLELEPSSFALILQKTVNAYYEKPPVKSMIEKEILEETRNLPPKYTVLFDKIAKVIEGISPGRYDGVPGYENLVSDLSGVIDVCISITDELGEESLQKTRDEDHQWITTYLVRSIKKILIRTKDNLYSFYCTSRASASSDMYRRVLQYFAKQVTDVLELYSLWSDIMGPKSPELEEILDRIGQKIYSSMECKL